MAYSNENANVREKKKQAWWWKLRGSTDEKWVWKRVWFWRELNWKRFKNEWMEETENRQERCVWEKERQKEILTEDEKHRKVSGVSKRERNHFK